MKDAAIFGPKNSIVRAQRVQETSKDKFIEPLGVWPTAVSYTHLDVYKRQLPHLSKWRLPTLGERRSQTNVNQSLQRGIYPRFRILCPK